MDFCLKLVESELKIEPFKPRYFKGEERGFCFLFFGEPKPFKPRFLDCDKLGFFNFFFCELLVTEPRPESFKPRSVDGEEEVVSFFLPFLELELNPESCKSIYFGSKVRSAVVFFLRISEHDVKPEVSREGAVFVCFFFEPIPFDGED